MRFNAWMVAPLMWSSCRTCAFQVKGEDRLSPSLHFGEQVWVQHSNDCVLTWIFVSVPWAASWRLKKKLEFMSLNQSGCHRDAHPYISTLYGHHQSCFSKVSPFPKSGAAGTRPRHISTPFEVLHDLGLTQAQGHSASAHQTQCHAGSGT